MMITSVKLTVAFEEPFWIGIFEIEERGVYKVSKVTFGVEPKDGEIYNFILNKYFKLSFADSKESNEKNSRKKENPKRMQRGIQKMLKTKGVSTKAQIALTKSYEEKKLERKKNNKEEKTRQEERIFQAKQMKKKEKHKGH